jgi:hypothetical protein
MGEIDRLIEAKKSKPQSHREGLSEGSKTERLGSSRGGFTLLEQEEEEHSEQSDSNEYENDKLIMRDNRLI